VQKQSGGPEEWRHRQTTALSRQVAAVGKQGMTRQATRQHTEASSSRGAHAARHTWRSAGGGAAMWPRMASAVTRQRRAWVRLTGGPSPISDFLKIFKQPKFEIRNGDLPAI
jgi:hypothetical protein